MRPEGCWQASHYFCLPFFWFSQLSFLIFHTASKLLVLHAYVRKWNIIEKNGNIALVFLASRVFCFWDPLLFQIIFELFQHLDKSLELRDRKASKRWAEENYKNISAALKVAKSGDLHHSGMDEVGNNQDASQSWLSNQTEHSRKFSRKSEPKILPSRLESLIHGCIKTHLDLKESQLMEPHPHWQI